MAYTTPDSAVSFLNHAQVESIDHRVVLIAFMTHDCKRKLQHESRPTSAEHAVSHGHEL